LQFDDNQFNTHALIQNSTGGLQFFNLNDYSNGWAERMRITLDGNIGIGTTSPTAKLHVISQTAGTAGLLVQGQSGDNWFPYTDGKNYIRGTTVFADFGVGNVGIGTSNPQSKLEVHGATAIGQYTNGTAVIDAYNSYAYFGCNTSTNGLAIGPTGNVGIGTTSPDAKLAVSGQVHAQEVKVSVTVPGPDYVFEKDYKLTSLEEIKNYIDQNKHLPEVPSAKEMEKNGIQLGEMNLLLLKKIEELTLYVIELKKRDEAQQKEIDKLKNK